MINPSPPVDVLNFNKNAFFAMFVIYNKAKMKILRNSALSVLVILTMMTYSGCGPEPPEKTVEELQFEKLEGTWAATNGSTVTRIDNDYTQTYKDAGFALTLSASNTSDQLLFNYTAANRPFPSPWPGSGKWRFSTASPETLVIRDPDSGAGDPIEVTYIVTETTLELRFLFSGPGYNSRTKEVDGQWVFILVKQP